MAQIKKVEDTGKSENFNPVIIIGYEVFIPNESSYYFEKEIAMPTDAVLKIKSLIGKSYKARVHPTDRTKIVVDINF